MTIICLVNSKAVRVDQSPMNKERWCILFECGHEEWVTSKRKPGIKKLICTACDKALSMTGGGLNR